MIRSSHTVLVAILVASLMSLLLLKPGLLVSPKAPVSQEDLEEVLRRVKADRPELELGDPNEQIEWYASRLIDPNLGIIPPGIREREIAYASTLPQRRLIEGKTQTTVWQNRGPWNVGGRTRALGVDRANTARLVAGGVSGRMWYSNDRGSSWNVAEWTDDADDFRGATSLVQSYNNPAVWYYGTGEFRGNAGSLLGYFLYGNGVFKSLDSGKTWTPLASTQVSVADNNPVPTGLGGYFGFVHDLAIDSSNTSQDEVYAAVMGAIMRSTDGGNSWNMVLGGVQSFGAAQEGGRYTDVDVTTSGVVYAAFSSRETFSTATADVIGVYRSADGTTWTNITPDAMSIANLRRCLVAHAPSNPDVVYLLTNYSNGSVGLWKYDYTGTGPDLGTWTDLSDNVPGTGDFASGTPLAEFNTQGSYNMVLSVKPDDENFVVTGGTNLFRSTDGYANPIDNTGYIGGYIYYFSIDTGTPGRLTGHPDQHTVAWDWDNPNQMYVGSDGGVNRVPDVTNDIVADGGIYSVPRAGYMNSLYNGYTATQFYDIGIEPSTPGDALIIGGMQDNGTFATNSTSSSATWTEMLGGDGAYSAVAPRREYLTVATQNLYLEKQVLNDPSNPAAGRTRFNITPPASSPVSFINPYAIDSANNGTVYYPANSNSSGQNTSYLYFAVDLDDSPAWNRNNNTGVVLPAEITAVAIASAKQNWVYYGVSGGGSAGVYRLENSIFASSVPVNITPPGFPSGAYVSKIAVNPSVGEEILVVVANYGVESVWHTEDAGQTWTAVSGNLEENGNPAGDGPSTRTCAILNRPEGYNHYFIGTSVGLFSTTRLQGSSTVWVKESLAGSNPSSPEDEVGNAIIDAIQVRNVDQLVAVGTYGDGVFSANISAGATDIDTRVAEGDFFQVNQYPNPFTATTKVNYWLPARTEVNLEIRSLSGSLIRSIDEGMKDKGNHTIELDASTWAPGVYVYTLYTASGEKYSAKMVCVR